MAQMVDDRYDWGYTKPQAPDSYEVLFHIPQEGITYKKLIKDICFFRRVTVEQAKNSIECATKCGFITETNGKLFHSIKVEHIRKEK